MIYNGRTSSGGYFTGSKMKRTLFIFLITGWLTAAQAELWLPSIFAGGMVLQSGKPVPVWGEAAAGSEVTVEFFGQRKVAVASKEGKWRVILDSMSVSSNPQTLSVLSSLETRRLTLYNVFVGEVWILAGQSNMGWPLSKSEGGNEAAAEADYPWLRIFKQWPNQGASDEPTRDVTGGQWVVCKPQQAAQLSGVGFFFARALQPNMKGVPIALINTQMGATYAECWIDFQTLENTPSAKPFLDKAASEIKPGESDPNGFWGENNFRRPSALFNGKVSPLQPFAARGVIWYQGEGNSQKWLSPGYADTLTALVQSWRTGFEQPELPFLVVQLPRYGAGAVNDWPAVRSAQAQVAVELPRVELVVTIDCGEEANIHPADKKTIGERLARMARKEVYGEPGLAARGPRAISASRREGQLEVIFALDHAVLQKTSEPLAGFAWVDSEGKLQPAVATVSGDDRVRIDAPPAAHAITYAWENWPEVSLFDTAVLPASPFWIELPTPAPYAEWTASISWNGADSSPTADPDGDGLPNLLEYALDLAPLAPGVTGTPACVPSPFGTHLQFTFLRARAELTYEVLGSSDLVNWTVIATNPGAVSLTVPVTVTDTVSTNPRRFLRLRVTQ